jgi:hypothetical protein
MELEKYFKRINYKAAAKTCLDFLYWKISWLLLILFIIFSLYCVYVWYEYVYNPHWDEQRKQTYIKSKSLVVNFDKSKFSEVIQEYDNRVAEFNKNFENINDIFRLK